jgi:hypothetical protein
MEKLKAIKEALSDDFNYDELQLMRAKLILEKRQNKISKKGLN